MSTAELETLLAPRADPAAHAPGPPLRDRYAGVMLGVAVGDCLGLLVEGASQAWIRERFPGGVRDIPEKMLQAPWDDDLAQTTILAEALLARDSIDEEDLAARLVEWAFPGGHGIGLLTLAVVRELASGTAARDPARLVWERTGGTAAGNGAVMRCSPVALRYRLSPGRLLEETRKSAVVTHFDPRCVWSAIALNAALVRSLAGVATGMGDLADALDSAGSPPEVGAAIRSAEGCRVEDLGLDAPHAMGYTLKAMQVGLWALQQQSDFENILLQVVNAGGDTDTNGAVAGAIVGSRVGRAGIPSRWLRAIPNTGRLEELADRLLERCGA